MYLAEKVVGPDKNVFLNKVQQVATNLGIPVDWLMAFIDFESAGSFSASIGNGLGYYGLIQFGPAAAADLGTTTEELRRMTRLQQMDYVEKYFKLWFKRVGKPKSFVDLYLIVLHPKSIAVSSNTAPLPMSDTLKRNNPAYVINGVITKDTIANKFAKNYPGLDVKKKSNPVGTKWFFNINNLFRRGTPVPFSYNNYE